MSTGAVTENHDLASYQSLGQSRGVSLHYDSTRADARDIIHFGYDDVNPNIFSVPDTLKVVARLTVNLNGVDTVVPGFENPGQFGLRGGENFWSIPASGGPLDVALQADLRDQPTGVYPFKASVGLEGFTGDRFIGSANITRGQLVHVNSASSPFGSGWGIDGLEQIVTGPDGSALIVDGDGVELLFTQSPSATRDLLVLGKSNNILRYDENTGEFRATFAAAGSGGLSDPKDAAFGPDGNLYVTNFGGHNVLRYNGQTGAFIDVFVPEGAGGLAFPTVLTFGPDGNLYVGQGGPGIGGGGGNVLRYNGATGSFVDVFADAQAVSGLDLVNGVTFGSDGNLYVTSTDRSIFTNTDRVLRFNGSTGTLIDTFVAPGNLDDAGALTFGPDGNLYMIDFRFSQVQRYSGINGDFLGVFTSGGDLNGAFDLQFGPDGNLYVASFNNNSVLEYSGTSGVFIDPFVSSGDGGLGSPQSLVFFPRPSTPSASGFVPPPGDFSTLEKLPDGTFRRTAKDQTVYQFDAQNRLSTMRDRNGNTTRYDYDVAGNLVKVTDPTGLETTLAYTNGKATAITDPAGRTTQLEYDAAGNLIKITDPDGSFQSFEYDADHHLTADIDKRGNRAQDFYDTFGRATGAILRDGSTVQVAPGQVQGLYPPNQTIDPANAPNAFRSAAGDAVYTARNGNVIRTVLDEAGQEVSSTDNIGLLPTVERNEENLITRATDARGNETLVTYDDRGNVLTISDAITAGVGLVLLTDNFDAENGGNGVFDYTGFANWNVTRNGVDLIGNGLADIYPGQGLFLDMAGTFGISGRLESKTSFALTPGTYELSFSLGNNSGGPNSPNALLVTLGSAFNETLTVTGAVPLQTVTRTITVTTATQASLAFEHTGSESFGPVIDQVMLHRVQPRRFTYDPTFSQLTSETDELGHQTLYDIDPANGNARSITEVVGAVGGADDVVTQFTYTGQGLIDLMTDPLGRVTDYDYDTLGRPVKVTLAKGTTDEGVRQVEYDAAGNRTATIDENGHRTEYEYDALNRLTRVTEPDPDGVAGPLTSPVTTLEYDAAGNVLRITDPRGNVTRYEYDSLDRQTKMIDPNSGEMRYGYDSNDNVTSMIDELGHETEYRYDARDRLIESIDPDDGRTQFEYDLDDNATAIIDPVANRTEFAYDARSRMIREAQRGPNVVVYSNDFETAAGSEWSIDRTDRTPAGNRGFLGQFVNETETLTLNGLAPHGEVTVSFDLFVIRTWDGNATSVGPDVWEARVTGGPTLLHTTFSNGHPLFVAAGQSYPDAHPGGSHAARTGAVEINSLGYQFSDGFFTGPMDSIYRLSFRFAHTDGTLQLDFSALGLQGLLDESWGLDNVSVSIRSPDRTTQYAYDAADNLAQKTDRNSRVTQFAFDDLDRLTTETWVGGGNVIQYGYDEASNLTSATDSFSSLAFTHDARDRVKTVDNAGTPNVPNVVLTYTYDAAGNVLSMADAISGSPAGLNSYAYDELDRMTQITQSGTGVAPKRVDFAYNPLGQFASINRFSDLAATQPVVQSTFEYDTLNRLTALTHTNPANPIPLNFFNFTYDTASRITSIADIDGATGYSYDDRDELTAADHADPANPDESYSYDANGNRVSSHLHGTGYVTDSHNRLVSDGTFSYEYDTEGNMIRRTEIATGNTREFQWDYRNRLTAVIDRDTMGVEMQRVEFTYDAFNRRITKTSSAGGNTTLTHFVYDGPDVLLDVVDPDGAAGPTAPAVAQRYLHGPAVDQVLAQDDGAGNVLWHLVDHLGTVHDLANSAGAVVNHLTYDSYGNVIAQTDASKGTRYLFTGREFDAETGLQYNRARYYDAVIGRFVSEDPIGFMGADASLYRYVFNNPVGAADPFGLKGWLDTFKDVTGGKQKDWYKNPHGSINDTLFGPQIEYGKKYADRAARIKAREALRDLIQQLKDEAKKQKDCRMRKALNEASDRLFGQYKSLGEQINQLTSELREMSSPKEGQPFPDAQDWLGPNPWVDPASMNNPAPPSGTGQSPIGGPPLFIIF